MNINDIAELIRNTRLFPESSVLEEARQEAAIEAEALPEKREQQHVNQILKKKSAFGKIKEAIRMARKPRMRTVEQYLCDECDRLIGKPEEGFVVHGNIYVADPTNRGGLIGDNFPPVSQETLKREDVKETVLCRFCMLAALGLSEKTARRKEQTEKEAEKDMASSLAAAMSALSGSNYGRPGAAYVPAQRPRRHY